jgi:hypothetical protein
MLYDLLGAGGLFLFAGSWPSENQVNKSKDGNQHKNSVDKTHQSERFRLGSVGAFLRTLQINLSHYLVCIRLNITQFVTIVQACWYISGAETIQ